MMMHPMNTLLVFYRYVLLKKAKETDILISNLVES